MRDGLPHDGPPEPPECELGVAWCAWDETFAQDHDEGYLGRKFAYIRDRGGPLAGAVEDWAVFAEKYRHHRTEEEQAVIDAFVIAIALLGTRERS